MGVLYRLTNMWLCLCLFEKDMGMFCWVIERGVMLLERMVREWLGVIYFRRKVWSKSGRLEERGMLGRVRGERRFWSEIYD